MKNKQLRQIFEGYIPPFKAREGEREMKEDKYSVVNDNGKIAEHMTLEIAGTLVQALCEKWHNEEVTTIFIAREPVRMEEENIRFEPVKK